MKTIIFNQDVKVQDIAKTVYKEGQKETMSESSADHWLKRGVAEEVDEAITEIDEGASTKTSARTKNKS